MKVRVYKLFGREVLRIESHYEATVSDVVRAMIENRERNRDVEVEVRYEYECACGNEVSEECYEDLAEGLIPCESCGEMFLPEEDEEEPDEDTARFNTKFNDMTQRMIWDTRDSDPGWVKKPPPEDEKT